LVSAQTVSEPAANAPPATSRVSVVMRYRHALH
jgi:hypothetical protein